MSGRTNRTIKRTLHQMSYRSPRDDTEAIIECIKAVDDIITDREL